MAETPDPKTDASSSVSEPVPAQPENPNPNPEPPTISNPNPPTAITPPPFPPSFRPLGPPIMPPQYGSVTVSAPPIRYPPPPHYPYGQVVSNGFMAVPPPGMPHYQGLYPTMVRPGFPPRPLPPMGVIPQIPRPPVPGAPIIPPPSVRPVVPAVAAIEKPQTTVYVGKIASSVENDFMLSLLRLCGPVKSWKRAQDPSNGTPKGFGFCEFEAAEGILRALRLLTKLNIDGQELVLNINKTTKEYLDRYVEKKTEREKLKEIENQTSEKENKTEPDAEKHESPKATIEEVEKSPDFGGEDHEYKKFGIVSDEDREVDKDSLGKIAGLIKERLKKNPLPPPPPPLPIQDIVTTKSNSERPSKSGDGDSDTGNLKNAEGKNEDEITSGVDPTTAKEKAETNSPNRGSKNDNSRERDREKDRERDSKREKERELERSERERERERVRREKDRESKVREVERLYNNRLKDWEAREREQEHRRLKEKEREKEKLKERRREISKEEDGSDNDEDDTRKRRRRRSTLEEKRRKREREKEEDLIDRIKEEEEIAEAKKRAIEEERRIEEMKLLNSNDINEESGNGPMDVDDHLIAEEEKMDVDFAADGDNGDIINSNETDEEMADAMKHNNDAPTKKLGFGLVASGKKTAVPSVFHEEDDENIEDKKMRPLVPLDYSTEELQSVQTTPHSSTPPNLLAAAEFAKRISGVNNYKEKKSEVERDRNGRSSERGRHRDRDREYNDNKEKVHDRSYDRDREDKPKPENKKLLDAKQLIDMIPKTKQELFSYEINWAVYDKHDLHEKMRPWISKKITEFLGEEEETLVEYIVSSTKDHVQASKMLELLQSILDDEAEMFVLKMWRMLIFEIKRVETGLTVKQKP